MSKLLLIGGSDGSCGAGVFADYETLKSFGSRVNVVITSLTSQSDELFVESFPVSQLCLRSQLEVISNVNWDAVKIGMLPNVETVEVVAEYIDICGLRKVVLDPVLQSSSGGHLSSVETLDAMKVILFPKVNLITPNLMEASLILGLANEQKVEMEELARRCLEFGSKAVLLKGGHLEGEVCYDVFVEKDNANSLKVFERERLKGGTSCRGTGCRLSSAIAYFYANGGDLRAAVSSGIEFLQDYLKSYLMNQPESAARISSSVDAL